MSHVTTVMIISPHSTFPDDVNERLTKLHHRDYYEEGDRFPVLESASGIDDFLGGGKYPSGSMLWIGWNYCHIEDVVEAIGPAEDITIWWETEGEFAGVHKVNWTYPHI